MTARFSWKATLPLAVAALLTACGGSGGSSSSGGSDDSAPPCTGSAAWCAPVGATVKGVTIFDGWEDLRVIPAPVNVKGGWTDSVAVTADGEHMLFGYSTFDFPKLNVGLHLTPPVVNFVKTGARRTGQTTDDFQIFQADLSNGKWGVTKQPAGNNSYSEASASYNEDRGLMVFSRFDATTHDATLWAAVYNGSSWEAPFPLPGYLDADGVYINAATSTHCPGEGGDDNGFIIGPSTLPVTLYWESHRGSVDGTTCGGGRHIYKSTYNGSSWTPVELVPGVGEGVDDSQVSFSPDGMTAYWTSVRVYNSVLTYSLFTGDWDGGTYANIRPL
ncbi:MAG TPA: hypothetical protein VF678_05850, partial [bacterium]